MSKETWHIWRSLRVDSSSNGGMTGSRTSRMGSNEGLLFGQWSSDSSYLPGLRMTTSQKPFFAPAFNAYSMLPSVFVLQCCGNKVCPCSYSVSKHSQKWFKDHWRHSSRTLLLSACERQIKPFRLNSFGTSSSIVESKSQLRSDCSCRDFEIASYDWRWSSIMCFCFRHWWEVFFKSPIKTFHVSKMSEKHRHQNSSLHPSSAPPTIGGWEK